MKQNTRNERRRNEIVTAGAKRINRKKASERQTNSLIHICCAFLPYIIYL